MNTTLHLAPIGQDKTALTISLLRQYTDARQNSIPMVWVLVATRRQEMHFRKRLIEAEVGPAAIFNIEFFNFYALNARLLKIAGTPVRRLTGLMRHKILRQLLLQMRGDGQLAYFHRIAETRGFVSVLAELIDELKQNHIDVDDFAKAARSAKDREIASIYKRYQDTLRRADLADVEGEGWLALAMLRQQKAAAAKVDMLLVDGYDQFTQVQAELMAELSRAIDQVRITLTASPAEAALRLRSRSALARQRLETAYKAAGISLALREVNQAPGIRHEALHQLGQRIFRGLPAASNSDAIKLIEMPDPAEETRTVLREVKRLLLAGNSAEDILIAIRDWERYAAYFDQGSQEYALPLLLHYDRSYRRAPVIAVLVDLLELAPRFRRRDLLDVLRSPYFDAELDDRQVDLLDRFSLEQRFLGGSKAEWLELVRLAQPDVNVDGAVESLAATSTEPASALGAKLSAFFDGVTPPEFATYADYISWLAALLGLDPAAGSEDDSSGYSLNVVRNAVEHQAANPAIVERDIGALKGLQAILRDLQASDEVMQATLGPAKNPGWQQFWSDLKYALETGADDSISQPRQNQVLVTTAAEARGLPHDHVFVLGLAEGLFPAEASEDPLYLDSEREQLKTRGIPLGTRAERVDDRGLFNELISLPRKTLTLSRPTYQAGREWIESCFWQAVRAVVPDTPIQSRPVGQAIRPHEAASSAELMLAVADQLGRQDAADVELALRARNWLLAQSDLGEQWRRLNHGRSVEMRRIALNQFDEYSGILSRPALLDEVAHLLGDDRIWSATQLNDFGLCPFRFFAKRMLALTSAEEPEAGADSLQLGALNHKILEESYRKIRLLELQIEEENQDDALAILAAAAHKIMPRAPELLSFRETSTWMEESRFLLKRLEALIKLDFSTKSPLNAGKTRYVYRQEESIGETKINLGHGTKPLRVTALIDRIDNVDGKLIVVDYKTGGKSISRRQMEIGRDFQMMVYLLAMTSELENIGAEEEVTGGMFWHLRDLRTSGRLSTEDQDDISAIALAKAHIARNLRMGRAGQFPVHATELENGKCVRHCEYSRLCRKHLTGNRDFQPETSKTGGHS